MRGFDDAVRELLRDAKARDEESLRQWNDHLSATEQGVVMAHLAFALLHGLLSSASSQIRQSGRPCQLRPYGPTLQIDAPERQVVCTCMLQDDAIVIDFHAYAAASRRDVWRPTVTQVTEFASLFAGVQDLSLRIVKHVVGGG